MRTLATESVYQQVLRGDWRELEPPLRTYFGPIPPGTVGVGHGTYEFAGSSVNLLRPLFALTARHGILFPEVGRDVSFTVINDPQPDGSLAATRTFAFPGRTRVMRDTVTVVEGRLIERMGTRGRLELALDIAVVHGGMRLVSQGLSLRLGTLRLPLPAFARVSVDERAAGEGQRVDVRVRSPLVGEVFRYTGTFTYAHVASGQREAL
jgi:hypothetical protein